MTINCSCLTLRAIVQLESVVCRWIFSWVAECLKRTQMNHNYLKQTQSAACEWSKHQQVICDEKFDFNKIKNKIPKLFSYTFTTKWWWCVISQVQLIIQLVGSTKKQMYGTILDILPVKVHRTILPINVQSKLNTSMYIFWIVTKYTKNSISLRIMNCHCDKMTR